MKTARVTGPLALPCPNGVTKFSYPGAPEKAQIAVEGADHLYREIRIENTLTDENGRKVGLKPGAEEIQGAGRRHRRRHQGEETATGQGLAGFVPLYHRPTSFPAQMLLPFRVVCAVALAATGQHFQIRIEMMELELEPFRRLAERVTQIASEYLESIDAQLISPATSGDETLRLFRTPLPEDGIGETALNALPEVFTAAGPVND